MNQDTNAVGNIGKPEIEFENIQDLLEGAVRDTNYSNLYSTSDYDDYYAMSTDKIPDDEIHQQSDELTLKQQEGIEKEISENIPLVGKKIDVLETLLPEYTQDPIYQKKVRQLSEGYSYMRRMRPDGNCFFRAFSYSALEQLLGKPEEAKVFRSKVEKSRDKLTQAGFTQFTVEDFYELLIEMVDKVIDGLDSDGLEKEFETVQLAEYLVVYLRILTSAELKNSADFYQNFIEGTTLEEFCQLEVEPMSKESDHLQIVAITTALELPVRVIYMDRGVGAIHDFPEVEGVIPSIHLLYRPGHYDILYPKEAA